MTQTILICLGLTMFVDSLFEKWNIWDWIEFHGSKTNSEFFYQLSKCRFCLRFHLATILTLILIPFVGFEWSILVVPGVVSGLIRLINR